MFAGKDAKKYFAECLRTAFLWTTTSETLQVSLQTYYVYSMLKRRANVRFHIVSTWNTRGVFLGMFLNLQKNKIYFFVSNIRRSDF